MVRRRYATAASAVAIVLLSLLSRHKGDSVSKLSARLPFLWSMLGEARRRRRPGDDDDRASFSAPSGGARVGAEESAGGGGEDGVGGEGEGVPIGNGTTFLLGIFSSDTAEGAARRELIRETYLSSGGGGGRLRRPAGGGGGGGGMCPLREYLELDAGGRDGCVVAYAFVVGIPSAAAGSAAAAPPPGGATRGGGIDGEEGGDVVRLDVPDDDDGRREYAATIAWLSYGSSLADVFGVDYVAKADHSTLLDAYALLETVRLDLPPSPFNRRRYGGRTMVDLGMSGSPLVYMSGEFYFVSSDLARYAAAEAAKRAEGVQAAEEGRWWRRRRRRRRRTSSTKEDALLGATIMSRGRAVSIIHCRFWTYPVDGEVEWRSIWEGSGHGRARRMLAPPPTMPFPLWARVPLALFPYL